ncbi:hypothetical protein EON64_12955 [archaeon]|nr:MAG: hypothetical protein EON64_12955 [archaeon]
MKADATACANLQSLTMLHKQLGLEELLPVADSFVVYESQCNPTLYVDNHLLSFVYDSYRTVIKKVARPMPIGRSVVQAAYSAHLQVST